MELIHSFRHEATGSIATPPLDGMLSFCGCLFVVVVVVVLMEGMKNKKW